jgi:hypothetical protein
LEGGVVCDEGKYAGTTTAETVSDLTLTPTYGKCHTAGSEPGTTTIAVNGCTYTFTVAKGTTNSTKQTVQLLCPAGKVIEINHPNCKVTIPAQTINSGATYATLFENSVHLLTISLSLQINIQFHGGICVFTGTNHTGTIHGTFTVGVRSLIGILRNITAT